MRGWIKGFFNCSLGGLASDTVYGYTTTENRVRKDDRVDSMVG